MRIERRFHASSGELFQEAAHGEAAPWSRGAVERPVQLVGLLKIQLYLSIYLV